MIEMSTLSRVERCNSTLLLLFYNNLGNPTVPLNAGIVTKVAGMSLNNANAR